MGFSNLIVLIAAFAISGMFSFSAYADPENLVITDVEFQGGISFDVFDPDGIKSVTQQAGKFCPGEVRPISDCSAPPTSVIFQYDTNHFCDDSFGSVFEITDCQDDNTTETWLLGGTGGQSDAICIDGCDSTHVLTCEITLDTSQEVPPPNIAGFSPMGEATIIVDTVNGNLAISGTYAGMTSNVVGSHLHGPAPPGETAAIIIFIPNDGGTTGTFNDVGNLNAQNLMELLDGLTYINVHTENNAPGEIRGQVICAAPIPVGGELLPIDSTSLLVAGAQSFSWMIPLVLSGIGIGLFAVSRKSNE